MTPNDYLAFCEIVEGFAALRGKDLPKAAIKLYWSAMQHWSLEEFRAAAEHLLRNCQFMPTPYDFEQLREATGVAADEAWERARKACSSCIVAGQLTGGGTCGDPLIDRAVAAIGGYKAIAMCSAEHIGLVAKRFAESYAEVRTSTEVRESLPLLERAAHPLLPAAKLLASRVSSDPKTGHTGKPQSHKHEEP